MKHIKLFEGFDKSDYYKEIGGRQAYHEELFGQVADSIPLPSTIDVSSKTSGKLNSLIDPKKWVMNIKYFPDPSPANPAQYNSKLGRNVATIELERHGFSTKKYFFQDFVYINELEDEYFLVEYQHNGIVAWWLCDQWEGLVMLFKDKEWI